jgi:hypothetical protein
VPGLCDNCDSGSSYQFTVRSTVARVEPFAENRWRQQDIVDAGVVLRLGPPRRRRRR